MLNFTFENSPKISLIINSFLASNKETQESNEIIDYFNNKKIKIFSIFDINQEMNFSQKINKNIRFSFYQMGKIFKINQKFDLPQIKINNLILNYNQFKILTENYYNFFIKILTGKKCFHLRFFENNLVFPFDFNNDFCIYCYSEKKIKKICAIVCDAKNSFDENLNEILNFLEENEITFEIFDYENFFENFENLPNFIKNNVINKKFSLFINEKEIEYENFWDEIKKIKKFHKKNFLFKNHENQINFNEKNPYNFIEKLRLKKINEIFDINQINFI